MKIVNNDLDNRPDKADRKYFRIDDIVFMSYKLVSWNEARLLDKPGSNLPVNKPIYKAKMDRLSRELQPLYKVISTSNSSILQCLETLDKKISILSDYLLEEDESVEQDIQPQKVNIGGGGLLFKSEKTILTDSMLELRMKLVPENASIFTYAKVISCIQDKTSEQKSYKIALEYVFMDDDVRNLITRHVLSREQALLNKD